MYMYMYMYMYIHIYIHMRMCIVFICFLVFAACEYVVICNSLHLRFAVLFLEAIPMLSSKTQPKRITTSLSPACSGDLHACSRSLGIRTTSSRCGLGL